MIPLTTIANDNRQRIAELTKELESTRKTLDAINAQLEQENLR